MKVINDYDYVNHNHLFTIFITCFIIFISKEMI